MYRVALIGCGGISAVHARVLSELENTHLAACADVIPERAAKYGCDAYTDWREMLRSVRPDAVHILTPHDLHPEMVAEAASLGIAALTEKPPAIDEEGWERVKEAAHHVQVGVCFQNRYNPHILTCTRFLREGTYGALRGIRAFVTWDRSADYYAAAPWKGKWATEGGGALINQAIHTLDLVIGFLGCPDRAEASMSNRHLQGAIQVEDTAEIYLEHQGVPALIYASTAFSRDAPVILELHFEEAVVRLEGDVMTLMRDGERQEIQCETDPVLGRSYWGSGHRACIADFYRCLADHTPFRNDPASCEATMRTMLDLYARCRPSLL